MKKDSPIHGPRGPLSRPPDGPQLGEAASGLIGCFCHSDPVDVISIGSIGIPMNKSEFEKMIQPFSNHVFILGKCSEKIAPKGKCYGKHLETSKNPMVHRVQSSNLRQHHNWQMVLGCEARLILAATSIGKLHAGGPAALHKWEISATEMARDPASTRLRSWVLQIHQSISDGHDFSWLMWPRKIVTCLFVSRAIAFPHRKRKKKLLFAPYTRA